MILFFLQFEQKDEQTQRERETFAFSQTLAEVHPLMFGQSQSLMRISMATERLWLQNELAQLHQLRTG